MSKQKYYFSIRIINVWNSLPKEVAEASSINSFKNRLDNTGVTSIRESWTLLGRVLTASGSQVHVVVKNCISIYLPHEVANMQQTHNLNFQQFWYVQIIFLTE